MTLRKATIRLAHSNPELREALLPLVKEAAVSERGWKADKKFLMPTVFKLGLPNGEAMLNWEDSRGWVLYPPQAAEVVLSRKRLHEPPLGYAISELSKLGLL